jgi:SAM-dependent methyltransferase
VDRRQWNGHAEEFETAICDIATEEINGQLNRYVKAAKVSSDSVLVDLGCGIGSFIRKFGGRFRQIWAVDYAPRIIARAKDRCAAFDGINWLAMDVRRASEFIGPCADLTVCLNVITSPSPAKRALLWSSVAMVSKPGGFALIVVPSMESNLLVEERIRSSRGSCCDTSSSLDGLVHREGSWQKHFRRDELISTISVEGFLVRRIGRVHYPWSSEGLRDARRWKRTCPWDWICLAQRKRAPAERVSDLE